MDLNINQVIQDHMWVTFFPSDTNQVIQALPA